MRNAHADSIFLLILIFELGHRFSLSVHGIQKRGGVKRGLAIAERNEHAVVHSFDFQDAGSQLCFHASFSLASPELSASCQTFQMQFATPTTYVSDRTNTAPHGAYVRTMRKKTMGAITRYPHRANSNGTYDSICAACFKTISTQWNEVDLAAGEKSHICNEEVLQCIVDDRARIEQLLP